MNERQIELARHALGLDGRRRRSYRNHFVCGEGHTDHRDWQEMVAGNWARRRTGGAMSGGDDVFWLTRRGAALALRKGESLDPEDFPAASEQSTSRKEG